MTKLKAFTVIELIVVLLISTITISIIYYSYRVVDKMREDIRQSFYKQDTVLLLSNQIYKDIFLSDYIINNDNRLSFVKTGITINYFFENGFIYRSNNLNVFDTLYKSTNTSNTNFNLKYNHIDSLYSLINNFSFDICLDEDTLHFIYYKRYDTYTLLNFYNNE